MPRSTKEWIGKTDDTPVPPRVRVRVFERFGGLCHKCHRKIATGEQWTCEHMVALINNGENRESNLNLTCCNCLPEKNAADVAEKSLVYKKRSKHLGVKKSSRGFSTNRNGLYKRRMDGTVERREKV